MARPTLGGVVLVKFGERLKAARTAKHMSQQKLADVIGKSLNTVGLYERGLRQPSLETLCLLADTLDVYVVRVGLQGGQFGYATAIGLIQGVVGLILVVISNKICKKVTEVGLW